MTKRSFIFPLAALALASCSIVPTPMQSSSVASSEEPSSVPSSSSSEQTSASTSEKESTVESTEKSSEKSSESTESSSSASELTSSAPEVIHVEDVTFPYATRKAKVGEVIELEATVTPANADNKSLIWRSNKPDVASVSDKGIVRALKAGVAEIRATSWDNPAKEAILTLTVEETVFVQSIQLSETTLDLKVGDTAEITAEVLPENAEDKTLSFSSSKTDVVSVEFENNVATLQALAPGAATIFAWANDGSSVFATLNITVETAVVPVESVEISIPVGKETLLVGDTTTISSTVLPENATNKALSFTSSDKNVIRVDSQTGEVVAVGVGTATVTATSAQNGSVSDTVDFTVREIVKVSSIHVRDHDTQIELNELNLYKDESKTLEALISPDNPDDPTVLWSSADPTIVSVTDEGVVTAHKIGSTTITVASADGNAVTHLSATVESAHPDGAELISLTADFLIDRVGKIGTLDNIANIQSGEDNDRGIFYKNAEGGADVLKIGDDNAFRLGISAEFYDDDFNPHVTHAPRLVYTLEKKDGSEYSAVNPADVGTYMTIGDGAMALKAAAVGEQFRLTIAGDADKYGSVAADPIVFEFEGVDGYNIYDARELCLFDNRDQRNTSSEPADRWASLREQMQLTGLAPNGIVLQTDLEITNADLPSYYFYTEGEIDDYILAHGEDFGGYVAAKNTMRESNDLPALTAAEWRAKLIGSMVDDLTIYGRSTLSADEFTFEGNYHTINAANVKKVYSFGTGTRSRCGAIYNFGDGDGQHKMATYQSEDGSHCTMFGFNTNWVHLGAGGTTNISNLKLIGNGARSNDDDNMGGMMSFKIQNSAVNFSNIISSNTFTTFMSQCHQESELANTEMHIDRCKNFDSYNSLLYYHGSQNNTITNSYMKGAGGAIALLDEVYAHHGYAWSTPQVDCANVYFQNYITGQEPWFAKEPAANTLVTQMKEVGLSTGWLGKNAAAQTSLETKMVSTHLDGESVPYVNCIVLDLDGRNVTGNSIHEVGGHTGRALGGRFTIDNSLGTSDTSKNGGLNMTTFNSNPLMTWYKTVFANIESVSSQAMIYETAAGGHGATFPSTANGISYVPTQSSAYPVVYDATYQTYASMINSMAPGTFHVAANPSEPSASDTIQGAYSTNAAALAQGQYISAYVKAAADTHYFGVLLGMEPLA